MPETLSINTDRIAGDIQTIAGFTQTPGAGCTRPSFSSEWLQARDYVIHQASRAGCSASIDAGGNVHIRLQSVPQDQRVWLSGSHVDTVPNGGRFDGVAGVVVPLEILRAAHQAGVALPLELVVFAEEEGTTFGLGMLGSRVWCATVGIEQLAAVRNRQHQSYLDAGAVCGVKPERIAQERLDPSRYRGMIEVHIEQGPAMWEQNIPLAIVNAVNGRRQYECTIRGVANHAGSTPMNYRFDALAAAAECIAALEKLPAQLSPQTVLTVGRISAHPNAINVISDEVLFSIDVRSPDNSILDRAPGCLAECIMMICRRRGLSHELKQFEHLPAVQLDTGVCDALRTAARKIGIEPIAHTSSGALHDAAIVAPFLPTAMLFVASRDGISHNPEEFSRIEDIAAAARIVAEVVQGA